MVSTARTTPTEYTDSRTYLFTRAINACYWVHQGECIPEERCARKTLTGTISGWVNRWHVPLALGVNETQQMREKAHANTQTTTRARTRKEALHVLMQKQTMPDERHAREKPRISRPDTWNAFCYLPYWELPNKIQL